MISLRKIETWVALLAGGLLAGCAPRSTSAAADPIPEIELRGVGFRFFRGDQLRAVGRAERATVARDSADAIARKVEVRILERTDRPETDVTAGDLTGNFRTQLAVARGGVKLTEKDGFTCTTGSARIDGPNRVALGEEPVALQAAGYRVDAQTGFVLHLAPPGALALQGPIETTVGGAP